MATADSNDRSAKTTRRFPEAGKDPVSKQFAEAAQKLADAAGLKSRYLSGEAAEFRLTYEATKERGSITIKRSDGKTATLKAAALKALLEGEREEEEDVKAAVAALREVATPPKLSGRKLGVYCLVATENKAIREAL